MTAAAALLAAPSAGQAHHKPSHTQGGQGQNSGDRCVVNKGIVVKGTLVSFSADSVTLTVTKLNRHARRAEVATVGSQYTIEAGSDAFRSQLSGYEDNEAPSAGDKVRVTGKVAVTKRRCEPDASVEDRYDAVNVRRVKVVDAD
jgi:hypothetical protein